jgi:hypothetical protein
MSAQPNVVQIPTPALAIAAADPAVDRMGGELLKALVDEVRTLPAQWSKLTEVQQTMAIARLRSAVRAETEKALFLLAKGQHKAATVKIDSLTVKDGAKVVLQASEAAARDVLGYVGINAVLVMCNPDQYFAGKVEIKTDQDQPGLPLGAPAPVVLTAEVKVGDKVRFLSAGPDGLVRDVRVVNCDVNPPLIEVTGLPDEFAIALFEAVPETDPIAEVEAEERLTIDVGETA